MKQRNEPSNALRLPPKPERPDPAECCKSDCQPCILELYDEQLARWEAEVARIRARAAAQSEAGST